ncbi:DHA2 family efflux MFS transporter permease subunit [Fodinisporobacter ferrooxydans]|uniref:DHA2 family efflux MFS transporter permease subunit n=1 Tax=Fodinisporobacter ferrooxydans TaxID=2901836 RepID=A0ABY4CN12_9BACL|nr:DHA2 family efflux MFS transporter permease subunit [Alicyclobacillaceae bacterium MYW30-H2]
MASAKSQQPKQLNKNSIMLVMVLGAFVAILNQTLLNVAIPQLMADFSVSADTVQWLSTAYMLTNGVLIPVTPFLIDRISTRKLFITAMVLFTVGSFICSLATNFSILLIGRIVQAFGAGVLMPLMMTVILVIYPPEVRGRAMGTIAIAMFFAPAVGPTLSGWIIEHWTWRILFYVGMPIAIADIVLAMTLMPNIMERKDRDLDVLGFITSTIGFGMLLYGFSEAGSKGWGDVAVVLPIIIGIIFIILFAVREVTADEPMMDLSVFKYSIFTIATLVSCVVNMALFGAMILVPIYLQNIRGFTPLESGLLLLPGAIIMAIMSPISGALFDRVGVRPLAVIGLIITALTTWNFSKLSMDTTYGHIMLLYTFRMFGMSFISMTIMTAGLNQLPRYLASHGTAAANTARQIAASLGTAYLVSVMSNRSTFHLANYTEHISASNPFVYQFLQGLGQMLSANLQQLPQVGQSLALNVLYGIMMQQSTIEGINDAFIVATILTVIALVLSFFLRRVRAQSELRTAVPEQNKK